MKVSESKSCDINRGTTLVSGVDPQPRHGPTAVELSVGK